MSNKELLIRNKADALRYISKIDDLSNINAARALMDEGLSFRDIAKVLILKFYIQDVEKGKVRRLVLDSLAPRKKVDGKYFRSDSGQEEVTAEAICRRNTAVASFHAAIKEDWLAEDNFSNSDISLVTESTCLKRHLCDATKEELILQLKKSITQDLPQGADVEINVEFKWRA